MTVFGAVGPGHRKVGFAVLAGDDVPHSQPAAAGQDPACLHVEQSLVGHVHLHVLAEHQGEGRVLERQVRDVCLAHGDPVVKPGKLVEPPCGLTVFLGEIHGDHVAAAASGDVAGCSADTAAGAEDLVVGGDPGQVGQLGGGDAAHRVEVLQQSEVRRPEVAEVFPGGDERLLDGLPGSAGRVLGLDLDVCHVNAFRAELLAGQRGMPCRWPERARFARACRAAAGPGETSVLRSERGITGLEASAAWPCPGRRDP